MLVDAPTRLEQRLARSRAWLAQPWVARLLATLGVIVTTTGLLVPFVGRDLLIKFSGGDVLRTTETWSITSTLLTPVRQVVPLEPFSVTGYLLIDGTLSLITLSGIALLPLSGWRAGIPVSSGRVGSMAPGSHSY